MGIQRTVTAVSLIRSTVTLVGEGGTVNETSYYQLNRDTHVLVMQTVQWALFVFPGLFRFFPGLFHFFPRAFSFFSRAFSFLSRAFSFFSRAFSFFTQAFSFGDMQTVLCMGQPINRGYRYSTLYMEICNMYM